jgi:hypothetical protein
MVWLIEKKVIRHCLDLGFERVEIPIRVKFEFEVKKGAFVPDSLSVETLYNKKALEKRYPRMNSALFDVAIENAVNKEIKRHLRQCGFVMNQTPAYNRNVKKGDST